MAVIKKIPLNNQAGLKSSLVANFLEKRFSIVEVEPIYLDGVLTADFNNFVATKLFFILDFKILGTGVLQVAGGRVSFYDEANVLKYVARKEVISYDVVAAAVDFLPQQINLENIFFSRVDDIQYDYYIMNGYKLTIRL